MSASIDRLSFVASPNGFLTAARAATALEAAAAAASACKQETTATDAVKKPVEICPLAPLPLRPAVSTSVQVQVGELRSLLSLESRPLASLSVSGLSFAASRNKWWDLDEINDGAFQASGAKAAATRAEWAGTPPAVHLHPTRSVTQMAQERSMPTAGWPGWTWTKGRHRAALGYLRVSVQGLGVLDLTTDGQLHNEVVSHAEAADASSSATPVASSTSTIDRRSSAGTKSFRAHETTTKSPATTAAAAAAAAAVSTAAAGRLPVVVIELIPASSGRRHGGEVNASVRGLRVCFLRRFMAEVTKYFGPDGLGPVFAVARSIGGGGLAADPVGSVAQEQEEEKVAVVVGEEDEAIPDNWSVVSSDGGGSGVARTDGRNASASSPGGRNEDVRGTPVMTGSGGGTGNGGGEVGAGTGMRVTALLQDLTVVVPRSTHSREAAAVRCDEVVLEVS